MRLLVFCGTRAAIERYDMQPDWFVIVNQYPLAQRMEIVKDFAADPNAKMAVDKSMMLGWRAPDETFVLFDSSWPYAPSSGESIQATSRVRGSF